MEKQAYEVFKELRKTLRLFKKVDAMGLRQHSNAVMKRASIEGSQALAQTAVISYVFHKLLTKEHITRHEKWKGNSAALVTAINSALEALQEGNIKAFNSSMDSFSKHLKKIDFFFSRFVQGLMAKARVRYAADAYFYGLSLSSAAALTGADKRKLQEFVGATTLSEKEKVFHGIKQRLEAMKKELGE